MTIANKLILGALAACFLISSVGCANGPLRSLLRGAPCNSCQPPSIQPPSNTAPACTNCSPGQPAATIDGYSTNYGDTSLGGATLGGQTVAGSNYPSSNYGSPTYNDPYYGGSSFQGSTVNPGFGDPYSSGSFNGTVVPPINLPSPNRQ